MKRIIIYVNGFCHGRGLVYYCILDLVYYLGEVCIHGNAVTIHGHESIRA